MWAVVYPGSHTKSRVGCKNHTIELRKYSIITGQLLSHASSHDVDHYLLWFVVLASCSQDWHNPFAFLSLFLPPCLLVAHPPQSHIQWGGWSYQHGHDRSMKYKMSTSFECHALPMRSGVSHSHDVHRSCTTISTFQYLPADDTLYCIHINGQDHFVSDTVIDINSGFCRICLLVGLCWLYCIQQTPSVPSFQTQGIWYSPHYLLSFWCSFLYCWISKDMVLFYFFFIYLFNVFAF